MFDRGVDGFLSIWTAPRRCRRPQTRTKSLRVKSLRFSIGVVLLLKMRARRAGPRALRALGGQGALRGPWDKGTQRGASCNETREEEEIEREREREREKEREREREKEGELKLKPNPDILYICIYIYIYMFVYTYTHDIYTYIYVCVYM